MKMVYVHPAIRNYRETLFRKLGEHNFEFLFTSRSLLGSYAAKETEELLARFSYPWFQARNQDHISRERKRLPFSNFSFDLWRVFRYQVVLFSGLTSIPFLLTALPLRLLGKRVLLFDETWKYQSEIRVYRLMRPYVGFLVRRCVNAIVPASTKACEMFAQEFQVPIDRLFPAYNTTIDLQTVPRNEERADEIRSRIQTVAQGRKVILYLARIVRYKALDVLIEAIAQTPDDCCLLVVGSGEFQAECEAIVCRMGLAERVHFLGACLADESLYYYIAADIFVLPSRFLPNEPVSNESWGFTVNEAMSLEIPVVSTTAVAAAHDLIEDGVTGMLAQENDVESLAAKINFLLEDATRRQEIGRQGRLRLLERCNYEENFVAYQNALNKATGKR